MDFECFLDKLSSRPHVVDRILSLLDNHDLFNISEGCKSMRILLGRIMREDTRQAKELETRMNGILHSNLFWTASKCIYLEEFDPANSADFDMLVLDSFLLLTSKSSSDLSIHDLSDGSRRRQVLPNRRQQMLRGRCQRRMQFASGRRLILADLRQVTVLSLTASGQTRAEAHGHPSWVFLDEKVLETCPETVFSWRWDDEDFLRLVLYDDRGFGFDFKPILLRSCQDFVGVVRKGSLVLVRLRHILQLFCDQVKLWEVESRPPTPKNQCEPPMFLTESVCGYFHLELKEVTEEEEDNYGSARCRGSLAKIPRYYTRPRRFWVTQYIISVFDVQTGTKISESVCWEFEGSRKSLCYKPGHIDVFATKRTLVAISSHPKVEDKDIVFLGQFGRDERSSNFGRLDFHSDLSEPIQQTARDTLGDDKVTCTDFMENPPRIFGLTADGGNILGSMLIESESEAYDAVFSINLTGNGVAARLKMLVLRGDYGLPTCWPYFRTLDEGEDVTELAGVVQTWGKRGDRQGGAKIHSVPLNAAMEYCYASEDAEL